MKPSSKPSKPSSRRAADDGQPRTGHDKTVTAAVASTTVAGPARESVAGSGPRSEPFFEAIRFLWLDADAPSTRVIARKSPNKLSHTTVADLLKGARVPQWTTVCTIVEALGGRPHDFRELWRIATGKLPPRTITEYVQVAVDVNDIARTLSDYHRQEWELMRIIASASVADQHHLLMRRMSRGS